MEDYVDASNRHAESAEYLFHAAMYANASHLFGISVECVLKSLICGLTPQQNIVSRQHLGDQLWEEFELRCPHQHRVTAAKAYKNHFTGWAVQQRYFAQSHTIFEQATVDKQRHGARALVDLLNRVKKEQL